MESYIILIIISFLINYDASILESENKKLYTRILKRNPIEWAVITAFLFIVAVPVYYIRRRKLISLIKSEKEKDCLTNDITLNYSITTESVSIILGWILLMTFISIIFEIIPKTSGIFGEELFQNIVINDLSEIGMIIFIYSAIKNRKESFFKILHFKERIPVKFIFLSVIIPLFFMVINFLHTNNKSLDVVTPLSKELESGSTVTKLVFLATAMFSAPLLEEIIFRGYLFSVIKQIKGNFLAIYSVALIFALFHVEQLWGDWLSIITILCFSFCLTYLRAYSNSIIPGLIAHYLYNSSLIALPLLTNNF